MDQICKKLVIMTRNLTNKRLYPPYNSLTSSKDRKDIFHHVAPKLYTAKGHQNSSCLQRWKPNCQSKVDVNSKSDSVKREISQTPKTPITALKSTSTNLSNSIHDSYDFLLRNLNFNDTGYQQVMHDESYKTATSESLELSGTCNFGQLMRSSYSSSGKHLIDHNISLSTVDETSRPYSSLLNKKAVDFRSASFDDLNSSNREARPLLKLATEPSVISSTSSLIHSLTTKKNSTITKASHFLKKNWRQAKVKMYSTKDWIASKSLGKKHYYIGPPNDMEPDEQDRMQRIIKTMSRSSTKEDYLSVDPIAFTERDVKETYSVIQEDEVVPEIFKEKVAKKLGISLTHTEKELSSANEDSPHPFERKVTKTLKRLESVPSALDKPRKSKKLKETKTMEKSKTETKTGKKKRREIPIIKSNVRLSPKSEARLYLAETIGDQLYLGRSECGTCGILYDFDHSKLKIPEEKIEFIQHLSFKQLNDGEFPYGHHRPYSEIKIRKRYLFSKGLGTGITMESDSDSEEERESPFKHYNQSERYGKSCYGGYKNKEKAYK